MKCQWNIEELIEYFPLIDTDRDVPENKTEQRCQVALLLKCFEYEDLFPSATYELPKAVVVSVACQLNIYEEEKSHADNSPRCTNSSPTS